MLFEKKAHELASSPTSRKRSASNHCRGSSWFHSGEPRLAMAPNVTPRLEGKSRSKENMQRIKKEADWATAQPGRPVDQAGDLKQLEQWEALRCKATFKPAFEGRLQQQSLVCTVKPFPCSSKGNPVKSPLCLVKERTTA